MRLHARPALMLLMLGGIAMAQSDSIPIGSKGACMEGPLAQFGQYIGAWNIADSRLSPDGAKWSDGQGAQWNFVCLGDGTAVQDFWMPTGGAVGTNLRTYNPETKKWDIAWAIKGQPGLAHIQAEKDEQNNIVMHYVTPVPTPMRQITFFPAQENSWKWKLEISSDNGNSWTEVYRIEATRRP